MGIRGIKGAWELALLPLCQHGQDVPHGTCSVGSQYGASPRKGQKGFWKVSL